VAIVRMCWEARDLKALNANILMLTKRRGQLKQAIADMVTEAMPYLEPLPGKDDKLELIATLRTVTEGKLFVEVERSRLTLALARIREAEGRLTEASEVLQEVAIETVGSMEKREKAEFLLEQVRLTSVTRDWIKTGILANKMNKRMMDEAGSEVGLGR
jgi:26S proteasome regulatory subunit N5